MAKRAHLDDLAAQARVAQAKAREEKDSLERHSKFAESTFTLACAPSELTRGRGGVRGKLGR